MCWVPGRRSTTWKVLPDDIENKTKSPNLAPQPWGKSLCVQQGISDHLTKKGAKTPQHGLQRDVNCSGISAWHNVHRNTTRCTIRRKGWHIHPVAQANILQWQWSGFLPLAVYPCCRYCLDRHSRISQAVLRRFGWKVIRHGEAASQGHKRLLSPKDYIKSVYKTWGFCQVLGQHKAPSEISA